MKIIDKSVEEFIEELSPGQIIRRNGNFSMVTDLTEEDGKINLILLETGQMYSYEEESLILAIENPDNEFKLVTEAELSILKYFK